MKKQLFPIIFCIVCILLIGFLYVFDYIKNTLSNYPEVTEWDLFNELRTSQFFKHYLFDEAFLSDKKFLSITSFYPAFDEEISINDEFIDFLAECVSVFRQNSNALLVANENYINANRIDSDNDMAKSLWGKDWRLPSEKELRELKEKCSWQYVDQGPVKGYRVTGPNGSSIFFPLAGYMPFSSRQEDGSYGYYWSGESPNDHYAFALVLCGGSYISVESGSNYVYCGMSVRAVTN